MYKAEYLHWASLSFTTCRHRLKVAAELCWSCSFTLNIPGINMKTEDLGGCVAVEIAHIQSGMSSIHQSLVPPVQSRPEGTVAVLQYQMAQCSGDTLSSTWLAHFGNEFCCQKCLTGFYNSLLVRKRSPSCSLKVWGVNEDAFFFLLSHPKRNQFMFLPFISFSPPYGIFATA